MEWTPRLNCARGAVDLAARLGGVLQYSHDAAGEHEIFVLHLPADSRAPEPARRSFVCYRDAAESDSKSLRRSRVPKPRPCSLNLLGFALRLALPLANYLMRGPGQRCIAI